MNIDDDAFITRCDIAPTGSGVLNGWTVAVKDNIDVGGLPTTGGTKALRNNVVHRDAEVVALIRAAGARVVGKTNMHELGHGVTGINPSFGTTTHPNDVRFTAGGSSGGSALAVHHGDACVGLGTDTGGSARIPAAFLGLVGFRPSHGRYPTSGVLRISPTRDTVGIIARTVEDVRAVDRVIHPQLPVSPAQENTVIGVPDACLEGIDDWVLEQFVAGRDQLRDAGVNVVSVSPAQDLVRTFELGLTVLQYETVRAVEGYLTEADSSVSVEELIQKSESPDVAKIMERALVSPPTAEDYEKARAMLSEERQMRAAEAEELGITMLMYPTVPGAPPRADRETSSAELRRVVRNSTPATLHGTPAINVPLRGTDGSAFSAGVTFEHLGYQDGVLLEFAKEASRVLGGARDA